jgi:hypothetical protein
MADKSAEVQSLVRTIQVPAISKAILQSICAVNGIPKTGNKSDLQRRIIQRKYDFFGTFGNPKAQTKSFFAFGVFFPLHTLRLLPAASPSHPNPFLSPLRGTICNHLMAHNRRPEINLCSETRDWERLQEIRESIVTRAPIFVTPSLVSQTQPQSHSQPQPPATVAPAALRSQPLPQSSYYQAARSHTPPNYAMASYNQPGYGALNGLRSSNPAPVSYQGPPPLPAARARQISGLHAPTITYKPSPFYELKYQLGDVRTLEGVSGSAELSTVVLLIC